MPGSAGAANGCPFRQSLFIISVLFSDAQASALQKALRRCH